MNKDRGDVLEDRRCLEAGPSARRDCCEGERKTWRERKMKLEMEA